MARWTVVNGDQVMVIESTKLRVVSVDVPSGLPFIGDTDAIRDMRSKLGLAIGEIQTRPEDRGGQQ